MLLFVRFMRVIDRPECGLIIISIAIYDSKFSLHLVHNRFILEEFSWNTIWIHVRSSFWFFSWVFHLFWVWPLLFENVIIIVIFLNKVVICSIANSSNSLQLHRTPKCKMTLVAWFKFYYKYLTYTDYCLLI